MQRLSIGLAFLVVCAVSLLGVALPHMSQVTATCNNTTSDAATLNAAIASSAVGDDITIGGPCLLTATVKLLGDRSYSGGSRTGTILKEANGANIAAMFASDSWVDNSAYTGAPLAIRHLTLDGNRANNATPTDGIVLRSWLSTIEDVHIANTGGSGIKETNLSQNGTALINTQVNSRIVGNFIENSGSDGVNVQDTGNALTDTILSDNWIASSGIDAIHMDNAAGWMIERNHIYGVQQNALYANRCFGSSISDNYIEDFGDTSTSGTWYGIRAIVQGDFASTIDNNRVFNGVGTPGSTYVFLDAAGNYGAAEVSVVGNTIRGEPPTVQSTGLLYEKRNATSLLVASTGNLIDGVTTMRSSGVGVTLSAGK